jgi:hypothetical protein
MSSNCIDVGEIRTEPQSIVAMHTCNPRTWYKISNSRPTWATLQDPVSKSQKRKRRRKKGRRRRRRGRRKEEGERKGREEEKGKEEGEGEEEEEQEKELRLH